MIKIKKRLPDWLKDGWLLMWAMIAISWALWVAVNPAPYRVIEQVQVITLETADEILGYRIDNQNDYLSQRLDELLERLEYLERKEWVR